MKALVFKCRCFTVVFSENIKASQDTTTLQSVHGWNYQTIGALADGTVYEAVLAMVTPQQ